MSQIKVMLADGNELFREGLVRLLQGQPDIEVICQCDNGSEAIEKAKETKPDVVLMNTHMPEGDGIKAAKDITKSLPYVKLAMLTDSEAEQDLFSALTAGAKGYLLKTIGVDDLIKSVGLIARGEVVVSSPIGGKLLNEVSSTRGEKEATKGESKTGLSDRETEIIKLVAKGATNKEIAERLVIAQNTVKVHIKNILKKLELRNKQQAAAYAVQHGLMTDLEDAEEKPG